MRANYLTTIILVALVMGCTANKTLNTQYNNLGKPISEAQIAAWNIDIAPNGDGLPIGGATARQGASIYQDKCAACHGAQGQGLSLIHI